jgi:hypothetical protein
MQPLGTRIGRLPRGEAAQHVVGQCEPLQDGASLGLATHRELAQPHPACPGIDALVLGAPTVHLLANFARHALTPVVTAAVSSRFGA